MKKIKPILIIPTPISVNNSIFDIVKENEISELELFRINSNEEMPNYVLIRELDHLILNSNKIGWISWDENGTFKSISDSIEIGTSLILDPHRLSYTWLTTKVVEILYNGDDCIKFKTKNSNYTVNKIK